MKSNFLCKNYASFNNKDLVGILFVHYWFLKSPHPTLHTYLENKCGEYVEDNDDGGEVEGDKVEPHPPAAHGHHEPFGDHVPLVHHQQVKEYNQRPGQVVEVVGTVAVLCSVPPSVFLFLELYRN